MGFEEEKVTEDQFDNIATADIEKDCPICMSIMVQPVTLTCKHRYCAQCVKAYVDHRGNGLLRDINKKCPLCRG